MDYMNILSAAAVLGILGLAFGLVLAFASKIFAVKDVDERLPELIKALPGINCGGCGHAGCASYAAAILEGAPINSCPPGGDEVADRIAAIMGVERAKVNKTVAFVNCRGGVHAERKYEYKGIEDCVAAAKVAGSPLECAYGCLGFGTCVSVCPNGAIQMVDGVAQVDGKKCYGCKRCIEECPRHIISVVPYDAAVRVGCASHEKGSKLRRICSIGCLGCRRCEKACQHDAIHVDDNLAHIDFDKCVHCGECAKACPRHLILDASEQTHGHAPVGKASAGDESESA